MELRYEWLVISQVCLLVKIRVTLTLRSTHKRTSSSWNLLFRLWWFSGLICFGFWWFFSVVWTFAFILFWDLFYWDFLILLFIFHKGTLWDVIWRADFGVVKSWFNLRSWLGLFFVEKVLNGLHFFRLG